MKVTQANLENGLLTIAMKREIPAEKMPRRIAIAGGNDASTVQAEASETAQYVA
jgi:hypothetical protein